MSNRVRVIGVGSPVAGDTIGMQLVEQLREDVRWQQREEIEWLVLERPGAALLHYFEDVETVCLVDALAGAQGDRPLRLTLDDLLAENAPISSHHLGVSETLQLASVLQQLPPRLFIYGVANNGMESYAELQAMLLEDLAA